MKNSSSDRLKDNNTINNMSAFNTKQATEEITSTSNHVIHFVAGEKKQCHSIIHPDVTIVGSAGTHDHGSSKVKLKNIVDYKWEVKNYPGHLIAMHIDGKHIAYVINVNNRVTGTEGMVRVTNASNGQRALIKGMSGEVLDLQFAQIENERILACIDASSLYIYQITESAGNLSCTFLLKIEDPSDNYTPKYDKIAWCPYIPDESSSDDDEDLSHLIAWSRHNMFQCFNISTILKTHKWQKVNVESIKSASLNYSRDNLAITWICFSPDGTTLAIGSENGVIRFYQVYFYQSEPRCLHEWEPHNGKPVSSFFFLDDLTKSSSDPYWKYALTGADDNTELKVWDCGTWTCLQTVKIKAYDDRKIKFIAEIDRTASYLVLTNIDTRALYVLQINPEPTPINNSLESKCSDNSRRVLLRSISEFPLSSSVLSFSIIDAAVRKYKSALNDQFFAEEFDDYDEESNAVYCVVLRMYIVQPKSVQECHILYQPSVDVSCDVRSTISIEKEDLSDTESSSAKSDRTKETESKQKSIIEYSTLLENSSNSNETEARPNQGTQVLMSPEAFTTSGKKTPESISSEVLSTLLMLAGVTGPNASTNNLRLVENKLIEDQVQQQNQAKDASKKLLSLNNSILSNAEHMTSGGSSPSREVQEIMSLQEFEQNAPFENENIETEKETVSTEIVDAAEPKMCTVNIQEANIMEPEPVVSDWPKIPDLTAVSRQSTEIFNSSNIVPTPNSELIEINMKMSQLLDLVKVQSTQIYALTEEVNQLKNSKSDSPKAINDASFNLEKRLSKMLEEYLKRCTREHADRLDKLIEASTTRHRQVIDNIADMLTTFLDVKMPERILNMVLLQFRNTLMPNICAKIDQTQKHIQQDVNNLLVLNTHALKEHIAHVSKSQNIKESVEKTLVDGVQGSLQAVFIESMSSSLIPAYEKSSQNMFRQLHDAFSVGIKEFMEQFNNYLIQLQPVQDSNVEIVNNLLALKEHVDSTLAKHKAGVADSVRDMKKDVKNLEVNITRNLTEVMKNEIRQCFESQAASLEDSVLSVVRSQTHTPAPTSHDIQDQIKTYLAQGHINRAFHQALVANDLNLVDYTLKKADYAAVFNPCVLDQTVLLSLIQQISADMINHNEIKQKYLSDAILNLDHNDLVTKEHSPKVMYDLLRNCQMFLNSHSKSPLCSSVRMTTLVIKGMGFKAF